MDEQNTLILAALAIGGLYMMTKKEEDDVEFIKEVKSEEISRGIKKEVVDKINPTEGQKIEKANYEDAVVRVQRRLETVQKFVVENLAQIKEDKRLPLDVRTRLAQIEKQAVDLLEDAYAGKEAEERLLEVRRQVNILFDTWEERDPSRNVPVMHRQGHYNEPIKTSGRVDSNTQARFSGPPQGPQPERELTPKELAVAQGVKFNSAPPTLTHDDINMVDLTNNRGEEAMETDVPQKQAFDQQPKRNPDPAERRAQQTNDQNMTAVPASASGKAKVVPKQPTQSMDSAPPKVPTVHEAPPKPNPKPKRRKKAPVSAPRPASHAQIQASFNSSHDPSVGDRPVKPAPNTLVKPDMKKVHATITIEEWNMKLESFRVNFSRRIHKVQPHANVKEDAQASLNVLWSMVPTGWENHPHLMQLASGVSKAFNEKYAGLYTAQQLEDTKNKSTYYKSWLLNFNAINKEWGEFKHKRMPKEAEIGNPPARKKGRRSKPARAS